MTLAEFLRARLDEDEAPVPHDAWHEPYCLAPEVMEDGTCFYCGAERDPDRVHYVPQPARVLAEVEVKRRIVDEWERWRESAQIHHPGPDTWSAANRLGWVCRQLATLYADHPDYDESLRP